MPLFEAACHKLPVVATNASGHLDFLYCADAEGKIKPHFAPVEFTINEVPSQSVWEGVVPAKSRWAYPDRLSFREQLRAVYEDYETYKGLAKRLHTSIKKDFSEARVNHKLATGIMSVLESEFQDLEVEEFS